MLAAAQRLRTRRRAAACAARTESGGGDALAFARAVAGSRLRATVGWQAARIAARLGFAVSLSVLAGRMIEDGQFVAPALFAALAALALSSGAGFLAEQCAAQALAEVADGLRARMRAALAGLLPARPGSRPSGALIAGIQRHPDALAGLVVTHAAARVMLGVGPILVLAAVAAASWQAALALFLCLPVMILFFVLIGEAVKEKARTQEAAFGRLAAQFSDRIRTLPTILANHALARERLKIEGRTTAYANSAMGVLRVAFLNAGVIDFFAALSIAVLAVLLGLGHLGLLHAPGFFDLRLWQSLFILVAAAEFFAPLRGYAEQYHAVGEGMAAAAELDWYFRDHEAAAPAKKGGNAAAIALSPLRDELASSLPPLGLVAIAGPSGSGKSTLLRMLAGIEPEAFGSAASAFVTASGCDWISTDIYVPSGKLADAIGWNRPPAGRAALLQAAELTGLLDERFLPGGLEAVIAEDGANLSGGQRMRIGVARALLSDRVVLADEPTAKLDLETAERVRRLLMMIARRRLVVVATHDKALILAARDHRVVGLGTRDNKAIAA